MDTNPEMERVFKGMSTETVVMTSTTGDIADSKAVNFVSASNSLLFFDGGSDLAYQKMFPGVDKKMKQWVIQYNLRDLFNQPFLPVGAACVRDFGSKKLICVPSMLLPQDISGTKNVYHCILALLTLMEKIEIDSVVTPCFGTGYGKFTFETSRDQTREAVVDFSRGARTKDVSSHKSLVYDPEIIKNQPTYYMNTRFIDIPYTDIIDV